MRLKRTDGDEDFFLGKERRMFFRCNRNESKRKIVGRGVVRALSNGGKNQLPLRTELIPRRMGDDEREDTEFEWYFENILIFILFIMDFQSYCLKES